jgi:hypothetical protein
MTANGSLSSNFAMSRASPLLLQEHRQGSSQSLQASATAAAAAAAYYSNSRHGSANALAMGAASPMRVSAYDQQQQQGGAGNQDGYQGQNRFMPPQSNRYPPNPNAPNQYAQTSADQEYQRNQQSSQVGLPYDEDGQVTIQRSYLEKEEESTKQRYFSII